MPAKVDMKPNRAEIADQLHRMLQSDVFAASPQQAKVFEFVVRKALAEEVVMQKDIRNEFFPSPPYALDTPVVRLTIKFIREKLLPSYYAERSAGDLVSIALPSYIGNEDGSGKKRRLPAGQAYRPIFSYNHDHPDIKAYREALHCIRMKYPASLEAGMELLDSIIKRQPNLASAYVAMAEAGCLFALSARALDTSFFAIGEEVAETGYQLNPGDWHAVCAYALCCLFNYKTALSCAALRKATMADPNRTRHHIAFQIYFFLSGKMDQALALMQITAAEQFDNPYLYAATALFFYMKRQFPKARAEAMHALYLDHNCWAAYLVLALIQLCSEDAPDAYSSLLQVQRCCGLANDEEHMFPGVAAVAAVVAKGMTSTMRSRLMGKMMKYEFVAATQASLFWMANNRHEKAIKALELALLTHEPVALFLPYLPIFDPLRKRKAFKALLEYLPSVPVLFREEDK